MTWLWHLYICMFNLVYGTGVNRNTKLHLCLLWHWVCCRWLQLAHKRTKHNVTHALLQDHTVHNVTYCCRTTMHKQYDNLTKHNVTDSVLCAIARTLSQWLQAFFNIKTMISTQTIKVSYCYFALTLVWVQWFQPWRAPWCFPTWAEDRHDQHLLKKAKVWRFSQIGNQSAVSSQKNKMVLEERKLKGRRRV